MQTAGEQLALWKLKLLVPSLKLEATFPIDYISNALRLQKLAARFKLFRKSHPWRKIQTSFFMQLIELICHVRLILCEHSLSVTT